MKLYHETLRKNCKKMFCGVKEKQLQEMKNLQVQNEELKDSKEVLISKFMQQQEI